MQYQIPVISCSAVRQACLNVYDRTNCRWDVLSVCIRFFIFNSSHFYSFLIIFVLNPFRQTKIHHPLDSRNLCPHLLPICMRLFANVYEMPHFSILYSCKCQIFSVPLYPQRCKCAHAATFARVTMISWLSTFSNNMKVVLLAEGFGSRISEEGGFKPWQ